MAEWDHTTDVLVVGSGAGGMVAAIRAAHHGLDALVIEKQDTYGGSTALSGGGLWIPANHRLERADGVADSVAKARVYLDHTVGDRTSQAKQDAYLENAREMVRWLESTTHLEFLRMKGYSDYYPERPGGLAAGRGLEARPLHDTALGAFAETLNASELEAPGGMAFTTNEFNDLSNVLTTWSGRTTALRVGLLTAWNVLRRRERLTLGQALAGRLRLSLADAGVPLWLESPFEEFVLEGDRVAGVVADTAREGRIAIGADRGVVLAAGGFPHNEELRTEYQPEPITTEWTLANEGNTGDTIVAGMAELDAAVDLMDDAWWGPASLPPSGEPFYHVAERNKPGAIMVNGAGERFTNESASYVDVVHDMYEGHAGDTSHVPSYFVMDQRFRDRYIFGTLPPRLSIPERYRESGYVVSADTISGLADRLDLPGDALAETVTRFNEYARQGHDPDFGRGESAYDRYYGDPSHDPNPCLGTIEKPPFHAVELWPGDLGTKGGLETDERARVRREDGEVIPGLYATGNNMASVMGHTYPGPGSTIGPAATFGYVAADHIAGADGSGA